MKKKRADPPSLKAAQKLFPVKTRRQEKGMFGSAPIHWLIIKIALLIALAKWPLHVFDKYESAGFEVGVSKAGSFKLRLSHRFQISIHKWHFLHPGSVFGHITLKI